jgi:hypothetical protein
VLTPVVTAAVRVTIVPLVTEAEERVSVVVVEAPNAKLTGAATVARTTASTAGKRPEKERAPDFRFPKQLLKVVRCDDMLFSVTTDDMTRSL